MTAKEIKDALNKKHSDRRHYLYFEECPVGTGSHGSRFMDAYVIDTYPSARNARTCYEVKVSKKDLMDELKNPLKRRMGLFFSNYFYFVTPPGLASPEQIPPECGLMEYSRGEGDVYYRFKTIVPAPFRDCTRPTWNFVATLLRRGLTPVSAPEELKSE